MSRVILNGNVFEVTDLRENVARNPSLPTFVLTDDKGTELRVFPGKLASDIKAQLDDPLLLVD